MSSPAPQPSVPELLAAVVGAIAGEPRSGQQEMATAIEAAFDSGEHLLVQAGTGTGKSLAYLTSAIHAAVLRDAPVLVATATLALQAQLVKRDLPAAAEALAPLLGRPPTFAVLKGRSNYVCRHRLMATDAATDATRAEGLFDEPSSRPQAVGLSDLEAEVARIRSWAESSATGDRDELPDVTEVAWRAVSVTARQCLGAARCPVGSECFAERARARSREVDVVVTNHSMLALDVLTEAQLLPDHELLVVDEGHELVDRATAAATESLTTAAVQRAASRLRRARAGDVPSGRTSGTDQVAAACDALDGAAELLASVAGGLRPGRCDAWDEPVASALAAVRDAASRALAVSGGESREGDDSGTLRELRVQLVEVRDTATRLLACAEHDVRWVAETRGTHSFEVAPLRVAGLLRQALFGSRTVVVTSATLSVGGSFDVPAMNLGLGEDQRWRGLDVGSPFDHRRQGILYIARHLPAPAREGPSDALVRELCELVVAAGGRTLGLFSSARAAREVAAAVRREVGWPVLCQGEGATPELVRQFAAEPETCLFGTLSLWQGIDVPGSTCSLVVVDRIPFPRPDDPVASARREARDRDGGSGFRDVYVASAALLLAQGVGRLIRTPRDRGVVAVLDPRLATAGYATFLRSSLPPFWTTTDPAVVRRSLANLREG